jgi:MFS family permease
VSAVRREISHLVPLLLAAVAEGAWISVIAGLVQEYALRDPVLGILPFAAFTLGGVVAARTLGPRLGERWPSIALGLVAMGAVLGVAASAEARSLFGADPLETLGAVLGAHPGGLLAGLAILRGFGHARRPLSEDTLGRLFGGGILAITIAALVGGLVADPWRARFLADSLVAGVIFAASAILALALTRQTAAGTESTADWPRNPAWVGLLVILVALIAFVSVPVSFAAPGAIDLLIGLTLGPLIVVGMIAGWTQTGARFVGLVLILAALIVVATPQLGGEAEAPQGGVSNPGSSAAPTAADQGALVLGVVFVTVVAVAGILLLVRLWMRRSAPPLTNVDETRTIDRGGESTTSRKRRRRRFALRRVPRDAVAAYRALMEDLALRPEVRRESAETPTEHARRLRDEGTAGFSLELLAADYALVRFGGVSLSARENRRAVDRWRALRRRLARVSAPPEAGAAGPDTSALGGPQWGPRSSGRESEPPVDLD